MQIISKNLLKLRKERKITQENLANYLGVTKAAISKWELNQSYPDITLLPIIASYFDISIDKLLGYESHINDEEVRMLYKELIKEFSTEKFDDVYKKCIEYEKKYYTCYFLQFHLGLLYCNHAYLAEEEVKMMAVYEHATEVFRRIELNCKNANLAKEALSLKSYCNLIMGKCDEIISDLKDINQVSMPIENILSKAYLIKGDKEKSSKILQISIFNNFINSLQSMTDILLCYNENNKKQEQYIDRVSNTFGNLMGEIFVFKKDEYEQTLRNIGFNLGKYIYILDAYEDLEEDYKNKRYNPFIDYIDKKEELKNKVDRLISMSLGMVAKNIENLNLEFNKAIIDNIIYSGVYLRYKHILEEGCETNVQ